VVTDRGFAELWAGRGARWGIVRRVFEDWRTPLGPGDGVAPEAIAAAERRMGVALPAALREWYGMVGRRDDLLGGGNYLMAPERLAVRNDGMIVFYGENQTVCWWAVRAEDGGVEDPPVYFAERVMGEWEVEDPTVSQFILQMTLLETQFVAPFRANAAIPAGLVDVIAREYEDLGLTWWHWPAYPGRRFGGGGVLISTDGATGSTEGWVWVAAKREEDRARVMALLDGAVQAEIGWIVGEPG
jgi:hypothetical protein